MKNIKWSSKKTWKVITILICLGGIAFSIYAIPVLSKATTMGVNGLVFCGMSILGGSVVILFSLIDILKSEEKEKEEARTLLKNKIAYHEKELRHYQEEFNKLK